MKKKIVLIALLGGLMILAAGCRSNLPKDDNGPVETPKASAQPEDTGNSQLEENSDDERVKTGLGVITVLENSENAAKEDGQIKVETSIAAVTVDGNGIITDCVFDGIQASVPFTRTGHITIDEDMDIETKNQLGDAYGMKAASGIGREWYEQAEAFAQYVTGMTMEEVKGIKVTEEGRAEEEDLKASATISLGSFIAVLEKAVDNAQNLGAKKGDSLGIWVDTDIENLKDAKDEDGIAAVEASLTALTVEKKEGAEDKITSCIIDGFQSSVNFNNNGEITTDLNIDTRTKNELKEEYGLKNASGIGKEWYEQAAAFADYVTGKTKEEVDGIKVEEGVAEDVDLLASVTIKIGDFIDLIEDAMEHIK